MKHYGDITQISANDVEIVDCIIGGSPCQDLSVAGKRAGLAGERSGLYMEQIRICKEMRKHDIEVNGHTGEDVRPRYMVWENVPGAFSSNKGNDFAAVLEEAVRVVFPEAENVIVPDKGKWTNAGCVYDYNGKWSVAWRVHDAQYWGVPQRRRRISLVCDFNGMSAPDMVFERKEYIDPFTPTEKAKWKPICYMYYNGGWLLSDYLNRYDPRSFGEEPIEMVETRLSEILEDEPDAKYNLSEKACRGILNRAKKRGKELPELLRDALIKQSNMTDEEITEYMMPSEAEKLYPDRDNILWLDRTITDCADETDDSDEE